MFLNQIEGFPVVFMLYLPKNVLALMSVFCFCLVQAYRAAIFGANVLVIFAEKIGQCILIIIDLKSHLLAQQRLIFALGRPHYLLIMEMRSSKSCTS